MTIFRNILGLVCVSFLLGGCATFNANQLLVESFSNEEKAELLFRDGLAMYNVELIQNNNLQAIPAIRARFQDALTLDPGHPRAGQYLEEMTTLVQRRFDGYLKAAQDLKAKETRTSAEDYRLVLNIKLAADINAFHPAVIILSLGTGDIRKEQIILRETRIRELQPAVLAETNRQRLVRPLATINGVLAELTAIDPRNRVVRDSRHSLDGHVAGLVSADIASAQTAIEAKRFADAEAILLAAERTVAAITRERNQTIDDLKYRLYIAWANEALTARRYQLATEKVNLALAIRQTTEAQNLKNRIAQAAATRDYDAEINDILASVDSLINRGNLTNAWETIQANLPRLRVQANRDRLRAKQPVIMERLRVIYQEGLALYNEEDYEAARAKLLIVVRIAPDYEQAQAYLDRLNDKLRALSGG
ncbi:MAG: hypothetical protein A2087_07890 [Spirochaetes bacterium GWD1_61_31]|nr:MAG: hypothetical protein A2Y37_06130 [Spirochaetes bacterium GWB1_60_80]OHD34982.1 MAG: hypothetical protein A2004_03955 [Spirochaetes bacterium GWC1_61_12]OHD40458.1 MAG: hypothetical protein A2087_07890 [Spirochaetes bacterium GWD1_61_31]OHD43069.1 MAG: hypothetical protein A2Y35_01485 [Spirochaetes bacterium GWE1_60_18]OHD59665.1 MAG: hypothetical protein A2Y32_12360 [Spirochaetes bacterium GWF1_60_12]HAP44108.1 hypothetical protein [Spirochaetaceae bacterium]